MSPARTTSLAPPARGLLRPEVNDAFVRRGRHEAAAQLQPWVEHYWSVAWDLAGEGFTAEVVSHPAVHLTLEEGDRPRFGQSLPAALVHGVVTRRFSQQIAGSGRVFGVKFQPGGFGAFTGADVGRWSDRVVAAGEALDVTGLLADVLALDADDDRAGRLDAFLLSRVPERDERYDEVLALVRTIQADPALTTVELAARAHGVSGRTLQRLFQRYVGVGPKWVLQRARLHDAVERIDAAAYDDLAGLAHELGWFDQAHFTRDFTALVGQSPAAYAARRDPRPGGRPAD